MSGWHCEGANGPPWERKSWERCQETDSPFVARALCSKAFGSPAMQPMMQPSQPCKELSLELVPMPRPPAWWPRPPTESSAHLELSPHINSWTSCLF